SPQTRPNGAPTTARRCTPPIARAATSRSSGLPCALRSWIGISIGAEGLLSAGRAFAVSRRRALDARPVIAEDVAHGAADLAHRAAVLERLTEHRQQVVGTPGARADLLQAPLHQPLIAFRFEGLQARYLLVLGLGVDAQDVGHLGVTVVLVL